MDSFLPGDLRIDLIDTDDAFVTAVMLAVPKSATDGRPGILPTSGLALLRSMVKAIGDRIEGARIRSKPGTIDYYRQMKLYAADLKDYSAAAMAVSLLLNRAFLYMEARAESRQGDT